MYNNVENQLIKNIVIVGTGAMATFYAVKLSQNYEVVMLGSWGVGIEAINEGVYFDGELCEFHNRIEAFDRWQVTKEPCLTIWLTKSYKNDTALLKYAKLNLVNPILILQNGIGQDLRFNKILGDEIQILMGITSQAVKLEEPGRIKNTGNGKLVFEKNKLLFDVFSNCSLEFEEVEDFLSQQLKKLSINAVLNPITAIHKVTNGQSVEGDVRIELLELLNAIFPYFYERGIYKSSKEYLNTIETVALDTAENRNSMLTDLLTNRPTEVATILEPIQKELKSSVLESFIKRLK